MEAPSSRRSASSARGRLHLNSDWALLEPVDVRGRAVPPDAWSHTVWLTNLANHAQPLIRYDLGDRGRIASAPCGCGSLLPVIDVLGRSDDTLHLLDSQQHEIALSPLALATVLEDEAGLCEFQLRHLAETFGAHVTARHAATPFLSRDPMAVEGASAAVSLVMEADDNARKVARAAFEAAVGSAPNTTWSRLRCDAYGFARFDEESTVAVAHRARCDERGLDGRSRDQRRRRAVAVARRGCWRRVAGDGLLWPQPFP